MKTSTIFVTVAGASLAAAQLDQIPTCALGCAISSIGSSGCAQTDIACICSASSFLTGILDCIQGACTDAEVDQTLKAAQVLCAQAGVTITPPGGASSTTEAPASSSEPPVATEVTSTAPETTSTAAEATPTPTEADVTTASSAGVPTTQQVVTLTTTTSICPSSTYVVPPPVNNATGVIPAPPTYTGAANSIVASAGTVVIGAALAMLFA
ncbi:hypothetical protein TWF696_007516 [Orbilia brochopaga]|uniref:CFEM domain-containing protein n=1 Tax=Orbilia brochopaga TaxID=3140254 RepID=A0AAV9UKR5_9PEZI